MTTDDIDAIQRDIAETQARIADELQEIGARLTPAHAKEVMMEKIDEGRRRAMQRASDASQLVRAEASSASADLRYAARHSPGPVALIGMGAGLLVWRARKLRAERERFALGPSTAATFDDERWFASQSPDGSASSMRAGWSSDGPEVYEGGTGADNRGLYGAGSSNDVREKASHLAHDAKDRASTLAHDAKDRASTLAHDAKDRASTLAHDAKDRFTTLKSSARDRASSAAEVSRHAYDDSPLLFGVVALAVGLGIGLLLPRTEREDRAFGSTRNRLVGEAKKAVEQAREVAMTSAREGVEVARETAKTELAAHAPS